MGYGIKLRVWGNYALFTRPEMKVERVSYDVMSLMGYNLRISDAMSCQTGHRFLLEQ